MASSDPFSSSVIPFEVPEQMRAFAEKGVSQARDSYAKFKDVAETNNGTVQAVNRRENTLRGDGAVDLARQEAVRGFHRPHQGARRIEPEDRDGNRRTDQGQCVEAVQAGCLIQAAFSLPKKARAASPGFCFLAPRDEASQQPDVAPANADVVISRPFPGLAKARRCT